MFLAVRPSWPGMLLELACQLFKAKVLRRFLISFLCHHLLQLARVCLKAKEKPRAKTKTKAKDHIVIGITTNGGKTGMLGDPIMVQNGALQLHDLIIVKGTILMLAHG